MTLPIDLDLLQKRKAIPVKLAQLSYTNPEKAIQLLRKWGEKQIPITPLYEEIIQALNSDAQKGSNLKEVKNAEPIKKRIEKAHQRVNELKEKLASKTPNTIDYAYIEGLLHGAERELRVLKSVLFELQQTH
jgi:tRNA U34 5-carboxymethylaminomethyl modifying enzyme MnmG/GidA